MGPNGLISTPFVYGAYHRMIESSPPPPTVEASAKAIEKVMQESRRINSSRSIKEASISRNSPNTFPVLTLPLQSDLIMWRKQIRWKGSCKLIGMDMDHQNSSSKFLKASLISGQLLSGLFLKKKSGKTITLPNLETLTMNLNPILIRGRRLSLMTIILFQIKNMTIFKYAGV